MNLELPKCPPNTTQLQQNKKPAIMQAQYLNRNPILILQTSVQSHLSYPIVYSGWHRSR